MTEVFDADIRIVPECPPWYLDFTSRMMAMREQGRLPHALLLSHPPETDELPFIWYLAMSFLCRDDTTGRQPCKRCASCEQMLANTYPDFKLVGLEFDDSRKKINKNIKIEQIRDLIHEVYLTRSHDNLKILVIYPADRISIAGANSLLKTLEEPAENVLFILATSNCGKVPVTIRSRCQQWTLTLPEQEESVSWMQNQGVGGEQAREYLRYANSSPVLALKLLQQGYGDLVKLFKQKFSQYLKSQIDVVLLAQFLASQNVLLARRLLANVVNAYCYQYCGLKESTVDKVAARSMLEVQTLVDKQLLIEENNLDLQLQLIDVLISIKQIIIQHQQSRRSWE